MRPQHLLERVDLVAAQISSLFDRIDAHDRVGAELRTEAANASHELVLLRREFTRQMSRVQTRQRVKGAFAAHAGARRIA